MSAKSEAIAQEIQRQHDAAEPFTNLTGALKPENLAEAYAAQNALQLLRETGHRGTVGGRKIALASKVQQSLCGIDHPIAGAIYQNEILSSPADIALDTYHGLGIEYEVALTLSRPTDPNKTYTRPDVLAMLGSIHPAYEMIIDRNADYQNIDALTMIADNAWCAGIVLGEDILPALSRDGGSIDDLPTTLNWNDQTESASTAATDPLGTLTWVVNLMSEIGCVITPGQPVITGSVMKTRYPVVGDNVTFALANYASVTLSVH